MLGSILDGKMSRNTSEGQFTFRAPVPPYTARVVAPAPPPHAPHHPLEEYTCAVVCSVYMFGCGHGDSVVSYLGVRTCCEVCTVYIAV